MNKNKHKVFSVKKAKYLTLGFRKIFQNPHRILSPYIKSGMTVLDFGCGAGFLTLEEAKLAGEKGKVIAVDLQQGMLDVLAGRIKGLDIEKRIILHKCENNSIGVNEKVDALIIFYVLHEVPDKDLFFKEAANIVKPGGIVYFCEPALHVNKDEFDEAVETAEKYGFKVVENPKVFLSRTVILSKR